MKIRLLSSSYSLHITSLWFIFILRTSGQVFQGLETSIVDLNCTYQGYSICCCALDEDFGGTPYPNVNYRRQHHPEDHKIAPSLSNHHVCETARVYHSSPYEQRHIAKAQEILNIENEATGYNEWVNFITSDVEADASKRWLRRVKYRMTTHNPIEHEDDFAYLSRFHYVRTCTGNYHIESWNEWIEPITIHMRHPFAFEFNRNKYGRKISYYVNDIKVGVISTDHILLQNSLSLANQTSPHVHSRHLRHRASSSSASHHYLFDAGTSRFDSSLWYFFCAYAQQGIYFDHAYGWEKTIQDPVEFWSKVPNKWKSIYSFFNTPVTANSTSSDSPYRIMYDLHITHEDFVAFKLDIDHPETEIPMALYLANNTDSIAHIVDEFFFELHFRDYYMMLCCFGLDTPQQILGFQLDRVTAMNLFLSYRKLGIRSHAWP